MCGRELCHIVWGMVEWSTCKNGLYMCVALRGVVCEHCLYCHVVLYSSVLCGVG